jgi:hypothetical protein
MLVAFGNDIREQVAFAAANVWLCDVLVGFSAKGRHFNLALQSEEGIGYRGIQDQVGAGIGADNAGYRARTA